MDTIDNTGIQNQAAAAAAMAASTNQFLDVCRRRGDLGPFLARRIQPSAGGVHHIYECDTPVFAIAPDGTARVGVTVDLELVWDTPALFEEWLSDLTRASVNP